MIEKIIEEATEEREALLHEVAKLNATVGKLKRERAGLLLENNLTGDSLEIMRINEKLHNARRILTAWNRRRESLDFLLAYVADFQLQEGGRNNDYCSN